MAKPWAKYEVGFINHDKFKAINANAIVLWLEGKNYADANHTDGMLPLYVVKQFRFYSKKSVDLLMLSAGHKPGADHNYSALWISHPVGFQMHDYLEHNECREEVLQRLGRADSNKDWDRRRKALFRDKDFLAAIRLRDQDRCRYCDVTVNWHDRRGPFGATYDHIEPRGDNTLDNVVIACRGCNTVKGSRTPTQAGMALRSIPAPSPDQVADQVRTRKPVPELVRNRDMEQNFQRHQNTDIRRQKEQETTKNAAASDARSGRVVFSGQRLTVHEWMLTDCLNTLGPHADAFGLDVWFDRLDRQLVRDGLIPPKRDSGVWLQAELVKEAQQRGLPLKFANAGAGDVDWDAIGRAGPSKRA